MTAHRTILSAFAACAALLAAVPAEAAFMKLKLTGRVFGYFTSVDDTGRFGLPAGRSLLGRKAVIVVEYDIRQPGVEIMRDDDPANGKSVTAYGRNSEGWTHPILRARVKINGVTENVPTADSDGLTATYVSAGRQWAALAEARAGGRLYVRFRPPPREHFGLNLSATLPLTQLIHSAAGVGFDFADCTTYEDFCTRPGVSASVDLETARISAVPLPPALLLMAPAFAALGWMGRRRRTPA